MAASVYSRTLQKAAELIGGRDKLSRYLHVPAKDLQRWIEDRAAPPTGIFLKVVDYIIAETPQPSGASDADDAPAPRDCSAVDGAGLGRS